ncbi:MAG: CAP domain-containing protein [Candidatus Liptonbacteria bacterium]|nr:CAP domain-containing protein [Candidatus Liptonbacteria bacterium]
MKSWLKKYFIPHEENDHQPHILRSESVLFIAIILAGFEVIFLLNAFTVLPGPNLFGLIVPGVVVDETNTNRGIYSLIPLKPNALLERAALEKVRDMAQKGYFAHTSPDGVTPWYWLEKAGYDFSYAGENLAVNFIDSSDVVNAWMNSPSHKENILNGHFTEIGVATAMGTYKGHDANFIVQFFGAPAKPKIAVVPDVLPVVKQASAATGQPTQASIVKQETSMGTSGSETFVAVIKDDEAAVNPAPNQEADSPVFAVEQANSGQAFVGSPRKAINYVFYAAALLTFVALILNIFVKIKVQHPHLIMNGLFILLVVFGAFLFNQYVSLSRIVVS